MPQNLFIVWSKQWELGIQIIDEQHRGAACLINTLFYFINNQQRAEMVLPIVLAVQRYTEMHALTEEDLLAKSEYPGLNEHRKLHAQLALGLKKNMQETVRTGDYLHAPDIFMEYLRHWWTEHLCVADHKFSAHLLRYLDSQRHCNGPTRGA